MHCQLWRCPCPGPLEWELAAKTPQLESRPRTRCEKQAQAPADSKGRNLAKTRRAYRVIAMPGRTGAVVRVDRAAHLICRTILHASAHRPNWGIRHRPSDFLKSRRGRIAPVRATP